MPLFAWTQMLIHTRLQGTVGWSAFQQTQWYPLLQPQLSVVSPVLPELFSASHPVSCQEQVSTKVSKRFFCLTSQWGRQSCRERWTHPQTSTSLLWVYPGSLSYVAAPCTCRNTHSTPKSPTSFHCILSSGGAEGEENKYHTIYATCR